jgi:hypothetical protein
MPHLYNDTNYTYNASNLTYDGVATFTVTASGSGAGTETADSNINPVRTASGSGTGTSSSLGGIPFIRTASTSGAGTQTANWTKSWIFRPPVEDRFPWSDYRESTPSHRLFARANPGYRARNIFRLTNGTYTNVDPLDPSLVDKVYLGAHEHFVTEQEKADLVAAGYTVT